MHGQFEASRSNVYAAHRLMEQATLLRFVEGLQPGDLARRDQGPISIRTSLWELLDERLSFVRTLLRKLLEDGERVWELPRRNHQVHAVQVPRVRELGFRNWGREPAEVSKLTRRDPVSNFEAAVCLQHSSSNSLY